MTSVSLHFWQPKSEFLFGIFSTFEAAKTLKVEGFNSLGLNEDAQLETPKKTQFSASVQSVDLDTEVVQCDVDLHWICESLK